ncbi:trna wybutosine-synthesizing protein 2 [Fusarium flagelliforme]|uniref:tRNA wybutosine-synthesizing protein 2 n=1 Tax=Fusarium flagelliforme TaxID=2675880 RepID=A0A395MFG1_9HYPO|nr:trna wybutosine-synthesizing protein 2 [Fusarium flagelliforme]
MPKPKSPKANPIHNAISEWFGSITTEIAEPDPTWRTDLLNSAPKRFTVYEPMALLPTGSFTSLPWTTFLHNVGENACQQLWSGILKQISSQGKETLTHLAVNEGIPLHKAGEGADENVRRSPSGLRTLYGDFGPQDASAEEPSQDSFDKTLWVSTKQNGIFQTWAPRWTMFSRGNVKEKARLLNMGDKALQGMWSVDLYAGIGYFVFSYARLGMRVLGWEINPWSVEGLRRGAVANRWSVRIVQGEDLTLPTEDIVRGGEQIIVFLESNEEAIRRLQSLQDSGIAQDIRHINCGFLPTSEPTWRDTWDISAPAGETWLHLHENVGANDTETRRKEIQGRFDDWSQGTDRAAKVEHIEQVKTFAPGVWHCVFDVHVYKNQTYHA